MTTSRMDRRDNAKRAALSAEAAHWFVRLRDDELRLHEERMYLRWLKDSPSHIAEMLRVCRLYSILKYACSRDSIRANHGAAIIDLPSTNER